MPGFVGYSSEAAQAPNGQISLPLKSKDARYDALVTVLEKCLRRASRSPPLYAIRWAVV